MSHARFPAGSEAGKGFAECRLSRRREWFGVDDWTPGPATIRLNWQK